MQCFLSFFPALCWKSRVFSDVCTLEHKFTVHTHTHTCLYSLIHTHTHVSSLPPSQEHQKQSNSPSWCHLQIKHSRVSADQWPWPSTSPLSHRHFPNLFFTERTCDIVTLKVVMAISSSAFILHSFCVKKRKEEASVHVLYFYQSILL